MLAKMRLAQPNQRGTACIAGQSRLPCSTRTVAASYSSCNDGCSTSGRQVADSSNACLVQPLACQPEIVHQQSRRGALLTLVAAACLLATKDVSASEPEKLPKEYRSVVERLSKALRDSLTSEADGAKEQQVRRAADPAKEAVQDFVRKWQNDPRVQGSTSHTEIKTLLSELGAFYRSKGARARLDPELRDRILARVDAAEKSLTASGAAGAEDGQGVLGSFY